MHSNIVNVVDMEFNELPDLTLTTIEIGITFVDIKSLQILKTYSLPIQTKEEISPTIIELTGWTNKELWKKGMHLEEACRRIRDLYGGKGRLVVTDSNNEFEILKRECFLLNMLFPFNHSLFNVGTMFNLYSGNHESIGLEEMMRELDITPAGRPHRADSDSYNIAQVFIELTRRLRGDILETSIGGLS